MWHTLARTQCTGPECPWSQRNTFQSVTSVWLTGKEHLLEHDYRNPIEVKVYVTTHGISQHWRPCSPDMAYQTCWYQRIDYTLPQQFKVCHTSRKWEFKHVTSSPCYLQSNCKVENTVKVVKQLFTKWHESGKSECFTLLEPVLHHSFVTAAKLCCPCQDHLLLNERYSNTLLPATLIQAASQAP